MEQDRTLEAPIARGKALRERLPRAAHAEWNAPAGRRDPIEILEQTAATRLSELLPIRYGRMSESPFAFFRGSAAVMAADLANTPDTGLRTQLCGDAHLMNFGTYAAPDRSLVFDVNDFDETIAGPWEWDLKRLAASIAIAARENDFPVEIAAGAVEASVAAYREKMLECAALTPLDVWYARIDEKTLAALKSDALEKLGRAINKKARSRTNERTFPKLARVVDGQPRIIDDPPLIYHDARTPDPGHPDAQIVIEGYRASLRREQRALFDRYELVDVALKVVGVGSVGTRCFVALFLAGDRHPLLLQMKEANASVLAPFVGESPFENQGERVVTGQQLMQAASDIFLGWTKAVSGFHYYARQLHDMKASAELADMSPRVFTGYAQLCGLTLARAHARGGDAAAIAGYLGRGTAFDKALVQFAQAYAAQNAHDFAALQSAIESGRITTSPE
jgi:uncharacterized protein (DUF2252 family)